MDLLEEGIDVTLGRGSAVVQRLWCRARGGHFGIVLMEEGIEISYWNRELPLGRGNATILISVHYCPYYC